LIKSQKSDIIEAMRIGASKGGNPIAFQY